jgi:hypothetical protein
VIRGYLIGRPMPADETTRFLASFDPPPILADERPPSRP